MTTTNEFMSAWRNTLLRQVQAKERKEEMTTPNYNMPDVMFCSAVSGLWYEKPSAAGDISKIKVGDEIFYKTAIVEELKEQLEHALNPIHTCSDSCKRPACVMRRQRDALLKERHVLREASEYCVNNNPDYSFHGRGDLKQALTTPTISHLAVVSVEELEKWPCGCKWTSTNPETNEISWGGQFRIGTKCPRCQLIEKMEKGMK